MDIYDQKDALDELADEVRDATHRYSQNALKGFVDGVKQIDIASRFLNSLQSFDIEKMIDEARSTQGSTVGSGTFPWPQSPRDKTAVRWHICNRIASGDMQAWAFAHDWLSPYSGNLDDNYYNFIDQIFDPLVKSIERDIDRIQRHESPSDSTWEFKFPDTPSSVPIQDTHTNESNIDIFISHTSQDVEIASNLVKLIRSALNLSPDKIRCTSVPGHKLPAGAASDATLRCETVGAKCFIGIITPNSLKSQYVIFELGARWGANLPLLPVVHGGLSLSSLTPPLSGINAKDGARETDVMELVEQIADHLGISFHSQSAWQSELKHFSENSITKTSTRAGD